MTQTGQSPSTGLRLEDSGELDGALTDDWGLTGALAKRVASSLDRKANWYERGSGALRTLTRICTAVKELENRSFPRNKIDTYIYNMLALISLLMIWASTL